MQRMAIAIASIALFLTAAAATAQEGRGEISLEGTGFFTKDTNNKGKFQKGTESGGLLVGYRHSLYRWISAEAVYGYARNTQEFSNAFGVGRVQANVHQATGGFVVKLPVLASLRPYALAEGGALVFAPTNNSSATIPGASRQAKGVFVYGGGVDYPFISSHLLLRAEYRGLVYNVPDFGSRVLNTDSWTHTAQPAAGFVWRF